MDNFISWMPRQFVPPRKLAAQQRRARRMFPRAFTGRPGNHMGPFKGKHDIAKFLKREAR